jgi:hypothetical protein
MNPRRRWTQAVPVAAVLVLAVVLGAAAPHQDTLDGTWEMINYEGPAAVGRGSGMLLFADGRFSLVYTMDEPSGRKSGRAHAGRYRVTGSKLALDVEWSLEQVSGKGSVADKPFQVSPRLTRHADTITLAFEGGGVQTFRRMRAE